MEVSTLPEEPLPPVAKPEEVTALSDPELDALPFGIIQLSHSGVILKYNQAEAHFARLDRRAVLGRAFFKEVAPCTDTDGFRGRFDRFVTSSEPIAQFDYVFDFKFGAQQVDIELVRSVRNDSVFVCVNRKRFSETRGAEGRTPAPLQQELVKEPSFVLRDAFARRVVRIDGAWLSALRTTWDRIAPQGWPVFSEEWGKQWGRLAVVDLETAVLEEQGKSLRQLPIDEVMQRCSDMFEAAGWGRPTVDFSARAEGVFTLTIAHNALSESVGMSEQPRCHLFAGFYKAIFAHLAQRLLAVAEVSCRAQGYPECAFVVAGAERKAALQEAAAAAQGDVAAVVKRLQASQSAEDFLSRL